MINVALLGFGRIGQMHAQNIYLNKTLNLLYVYEKIDKLRKKAKNLYNCKIEKDYKSIAYTTVMNHEKVLKNNTAFQNFTDKGPIAFLPISEKQTSVVYSLRSKKKKSSSDIHKLIKKYNPIFK